MTLRIREDGDPVDACMPKTLEKKSVMAVMSSTRICVNENEVGTIDARLLGGKGGLSSIGLSTIAERRKPGYCSKGAWLLPQEEP